jgi:hypothetical protein
MEYGEFERAVSSIANTVGAAIGEGEAECAFEEVGGQEGGNFGASGVLKRVEHTLGRVRARYPAIQPQENMGGINWESLPMEQRIRGLLGGIKMMFSRVNTLQIGSLDALERKLRACLSGRGWSADENQLVIERFNLSEKCLGGCRRTCGISARASDPQMPWELFEGMIESGNVYINPHRTVWLGDGEVLIYPHLFEAVERLVRDCGCKVEFTTAGLIPPNRALGRRFFEQLSEFGAYSSDVSITVSFNFLFGFIKNQSNVVEYIECVRETLGWIEKAGCALGATVLAPRNDAYGTMEAYGRMEPEFKRIPGFPKPDKREGISKIGDAYASGMGIEDEGNKVCYSGCRGRQGLRPDGSLTIECGGFGKRGTSIGDVRINSVGQIRNLWREHDMRFREEILRAPGDKCLLHQRWGNGKFRARPSKNPVVRITQAAGRQKIA